VDLKQRIDELGTRFAREAAGFGRRPKSAAGKEDYWQRVQDLFMRDVTSHGLREMFEGDARETVRFFTREIELEDLGLRPWYQRWPIATFRVFEATAYRLSPARRVFFAVAVPLLFLGWVRYVITAAEAASAQAFDLPIPALLLIASTLLFLLLVLELKDKLTLKGDLEVARQIQFGLLPFEPFAQGRLSVHSSMRPANTVGGDYFDVIDLGEGRTALVVGDVAGKGMPAALLMALLQGSLRTLVTAGLRGVTLIARLNQHLFANIPANRLITLFHAEVALEGGPLHYVNAGHNPPFLIRAHGSVERLAATGVALGILDDPPFEMLETPFEAGDLIVLYTDGVTEAMNAADEEFGEERLAASLLSRRGAPAADLIDGVIADVLAFCGPVRPRDDATLMVVHST
jgi:serine phosphatase RsbU (regulator of sigma subunit)